MLNRRKLGKNITALAPKILILVGLVTVRPMETAHAQAPPGLQWQQSFGGNGDDAAQVVKPTSDGGYIVGGHSSSETSGNKSSTNYGSYDYWVVKVDLNGIKQWERSFGGTNEDQFTSLQQTSDGGYILGGYSSSGVSGNKTNVNLGAADYWVVKLDSAGDKEWDKSFGGSDFDYLFSLQQTSDGGYILGGHSYSGISGNKSTASFGVNDYWVVKLDPDGNKQWDKSFGGTNYDFLASLQQTSDGGYIFGGTSLSGISGNKTNAGFGDYDYWLVKVDISGNKQWDQSFGGDNVDYLTSLQQTSDDGYILGGNSYSGASGNKTNVGYGAVDSWIVKVNLIGIKQWDQTFGGDNSDYLNYLRQTSNGNYVLGGFSDSGASGNKTSSNFGGNDGWAAVIDFSGILQWDQSYGGSSYDSLLSLQQTADGGYILGGYSQSGASGNKTSASFGGSDYWLIKLSPPLPTPFSFTSYYRDSNNIFQAQLSGFPGTNYVFQTSTNLINWNSLATNNAVSGLVNFSDTNSLGFPQRFYRAQQLP